MNEFFLMLTGVVGLAGLCGFVAKLLKQPPIVGYVFSGVLLSLFFPSIVGHGETIEVMGKLGVTLLLFLVGLELPLDELKRMGKVAVVTGIGQIVFTVGIGYLILVALGFSPLAAIYISVALAFSSTIIIVKLLTQKKELQSLHGKISVGFLLVQDFVAIGIFVVLSGLGQSGNLDLASLGWVLIKGILLVVLTLIVSTKIMPKVLLKLSESSEILFVVSIGWCLVVSSLVASPLIGFGLEMGGFLAGLALANASEHLQIVARIRPLRDFFLTIFFVWMGASMELSAISSVWPLALLLSVFVLIGNPLIVMILMKFLGYRKRTGFMVGLTVAQISEFSLILIAMANSFGHVDRSTLSLMALVGVITMTVSTYMIINSDKLFKFLSKLLNVFEPKKAKGKAIEVSKKPTDHILLFGHNRTGSKLRPVLEKLGEVLVVDFNPNEIERLNDLGTLAIYGDISDFELYEEIGLSSAKLVISTVPDVEDNAQILEYLNGVKKRPGIVVTAADEHEAKRLYKLGADYVLIPQQVGGEFLAGVIEKHGYDLSYLKKDSKNGF